ncbi:unnamed protein product [Pedinophyceae sp. YPF-701]|nr:unnamed protein product [Pedinophyceae sp. YPF-701]
MKDDGMTLQALVEENQRLKKRLQDSQAELAGKGFTSTAVISTLTDLARETSTMEEMLQEYEHKIEKMNHEIAENDMYMSETQQRHEQEMAALKDKLQKAQAEVTVLQERWANIDKPAELTPSKIMKPRLVVELEAQVSRLKAELRGKHQEAEELSRQLAEQQGSEQEAVKKLQAERRKLAREVEERKQEVSRLLADLRKARLERQEAETRAEEAEARRKQQNQTLRAENSRLGKALLASEEAAATAREEAKSRAPPSRDGDSPVLRARSTTPRLARRTQRFRRSEALGGRLIKDSGDFQGVPGWAFFSATVGAFLVGVRLM